MVGFWKDTSLWRIGHFEDVRQKNLRLVKYHIFMAMAEKLGPPWILSALTQRRWNVQFKWKIGHSPSNGIIIRRPHLVEFRSSCRPKVVWYWSKAKILSWFAQCFESRLACVGRGWPKARDGWSSNWQLFKPLKYYFLTGTKENAFQEDENRLHVRLKKYFMNKVKIEFLHCLQILSTSKN